jgi:hypothetical protein
MKLDLLISRIFSARIITLLLFIFVVLIIGTLFNVKLGTEPFNEGAKELQNNLEKSHKHGQVENKP